MGLVEVEVFYQVIDGFDQLAFTSRTFSKTILLVRKDVVRLKMVDDLAVDDVIDNLAAYWG